MEILKDKSIVPKLQVLNVNKLNQLRVDPMTIFPIDRTLIDAILPRNITELHFQHLMISDIDTRAGILLCSSLQIVDLSWTFIVGKIYRTADNCKSLQKLIINSYQFQPLGWQTYRPNTGFIYESASLNFYQGAALLGANNIVKGEQSFRCQSCYYKFTNNTGTGADSYLQEIDLDENKLRHFNVEFAGDIAFLNMATISFSNNQMEYINPKFFLGMKTIRKLNFSNNQLWRMKISNWTIFLQLTSYLPLLENLDLSYNNLSNLPTNMFLNNTRLKYLNLAGNSLGSIYFSKSLPLSFLDISSNAIQNLDKNGRRWIDSCYHLDENLRVNISYNPFVCLCSSTDFFKWLFDSPSVSRRNSSFSCALNGKLRLMKKENINELNKELCFEKPVWRNIIIAISGTLGAAAIAFITVKAARKVKGILDRKRNRNENLNLLREGEFDDNVLVFLSFSSRNANLVMNHIYPSLSDEFGKIKFDGQDPVGVGDLHFRPGFCLHNEMIRCVEISNVFLAVISDNYCNSPYCRNEIDIAFSAEKPIILLVLGEVDKSKMSSVMRFVFDKYTHMKLYRLNGGIEIRPNWKALVDAVLEMPTERKEREFLNAAFENDDGDD